MAVPETPAACPPLQHLAIIMDGNGRWVRGRGLKRIEGHKAGAKTVRMAVEQCGRLGIRYLTLFSFSTENWKRSPEEIQGLMGLFREYLERELPDLEKNGIRLRAVGDLERLPLAVRAALNRALAKTAENEKLDLILAISYGGREEILNAARVLARDALAGRIRPEEIDENQFRSRLWTAGIPDPDLLIRTSGEVRISNFLLWQLAYSELVVAPELWPDFDEAAFQRCVAEYLRRERRFGLTSEQIRAKDEE